MPSTTYIAQDGERVRLGRYCTNSPNATFADLFLDISDTAVHFSAPASYNFAFDIDTTEALTLSAIGLLVGNDRGIVVGHTAQLTVSDGDGATNLVPEVQVTGTGQADSTLLLTQFSTTATRVGAPTLAFAKGGAATIAPGTIVTDDEIVGNIIAYADDGADLETPIAMIQFVVDGTPTCDQVGGSIEFYATIDGGSTLTQRLIIATNGDITASSAGSGVDRTFTVDNTSDDANAGAIIRAQNGGACASGDAKVNARQGASGHSITMGVDSSLSLGSIAMSTEIGDDGDAIRFTDATPPVQTFNAAHSTTTFDYVCDDCGWHGAEDVAECPACGGKVEWHDDVLAVVDALNSAVGVRWTGREPAIQHLAKLGVMEVTPFESPELAGQNWIGLNPIQAQWFTWSGMNQLYQRITQLEDKLALAGA